MIFSQAMDRTYASAYGKYCKVRNAAWHCLINQEIHSLPVPVSILAKRLGICLCSYSDNVRLLRASHLGDLLEAEGFAYLDPAGHLAIFYDDRLSRPEIRFTIAHELGHILLAHMGRDVEPGYLLNPTDPRREQEADRFAMRLLAPACVLWGLGVYTAGGIAETCDIPLEIAKLRARRMTVLRRRDMWLKSPVEQQLYAQFGLPGKPDGP